MAQTHLTKTEITLHWVVGIAMIILITVGLYMVRTENLAMYGTHKSVGMVVFVLVLWRAVVRLMKGWPENISKGAAWEHGLARVVHWVLIIGTIVMPISGMLMSYNGGHGLAVFGLELIAPNATDGPPLPVNESMAGRAQAMHGVVGRVLIAAIFLHVAGALKHHLVDRDGTLRRMVGRA